ncbi:thioredoxin family protein [Microbulbifer pacificus]|uniref:Thioredoxin family protein n=1 Tax=Microbulbifer pacificus TaxID=407164 RepID=A0AAU0N392_9GAMM|nr:thioredoxin family protein [Microbulbifer pacificus]WOX06720.1 thioredoxin family protein [Microbulbifer pacificus]
MRSLVLVFAFFISLSASAFNDKPYNQNYDPKRDPFDDFRMAQQDAQEDGKLILIILGGNWCGWCHRLSAFIKKNESLKMDLEETFVVMKINVSGENNNADFLSHLPEPKGYPYFVIVNNEGKVIGAQNTSGIEEGKSYSVAKFSGFIDKWKGAKR